MIYILKKDIKGTVFPKMKTKPLNCNIYLFNVLCINSVADIVQFHKFNTFKGIVNPKI